MDQDQERALRSFHWQDGYAAFSVSQSKALAVEGYIDRQKEHHRKRSFQEELIQFLRKHGVEYDERYIWTWSGVRPFQGRDAVEGWAAFSGGAAPGYVISALSGRAASGA